MLLDLDGFKSYNDAYGHVAGDALLARLGRRLAEAAGEGARPYRLGGDEFCVLALDERPPAAHASLMAATLCETGDGFSVTSSYGLVTMPTEAASPTDALRIADRRMYAQKQRRDSSAGRQSRDVLLSALAERSPDLVDHVADVAALAVEVARRLGPPEYEVDRSAPASSPPATRSRRWSPIVRTGSRSASRQRSTSSSAARGASSTRRW